MKYNFLSEQGVENFTREEAAKISGEDADHATRDLFNAIASGTPPAWKVYIQIMPEKEAATYRFNPFDLTKVWPQKDYPRILIGRFVLDRNPENYFADVEQAAFSPSNIVPGISFSPDKMLQARLFSYPDAQRYRLGANYANLPINCPHARQAMNYQRDGLMRFDDNGGSAVNYEPNSFGGPKEVPEYKEPAVEVSGTIDRTPFDRSDDDFVQAGNLYRLLKEDEKARLVDNLVDHMKAAKRELQVRQIPHFYKADPDYGTRVAQGLGIEIQEVLS